MTRDNHVIFSSDATPGVYRYESQGSASGKKAVLPGFGGVAADPRSLRWAAAQTTKETSKIYVFDGDKMIKTFRLPPNKTLYRNGLVSFSPKGDVCVAVQDSDKTAGPVTLLMYNLEKDRRPEHLHLGQGRDDRLRGRPADALERKRVEQPEKHPLTLRGDGFFAAGLLRRDDWGGPSWAAPFFWGRRAGFAARLLARDWGLHYHGGVVSHPA